MKNLIVLILLSFHSVLALSQSTRLLQSFVDKGNAFLLAKDAQTDSAVYYLHKVVRYYRPTLPLKQRELCARAANNLGVVYYHMSIDPQKAYHYLSLAEKICHKTTDTSTKANVYLNFGNLYSIFSENVNSPDSEAEAVRMYKRALTLAIRGKHWEVACCAFANMTDLGQSSHNITLYHDILPLMGRAKIPSTVPLHRYVWLRYLAIDAYQKKNLNKSTSLLLQSLSYIDSKVSQDAWEAQVLNLVTTLYIERNMADSALFYANKQLRMGGKWNSLDVKANAYKNIHAIYTATGDKQKAQEAYARLLMVKDSLINIYHLGTVENMKFVKDLTAERHQSALMMAQAQRKQNAHEVVILCIGLMLVAVVLLLIVIIVRHRKLHKQYRKLFHEQQRILQEEEHHRQERKEEMRRLETEAERKPRGSYDAPSSAKEQKTRILAMMDETEEKFSPDFSLNRLAELVGIAPRALSAVLNQEIGISFRDLLNQYRVRAACVRLADEKEFGKYTIEAIAESVGYKSRTSLVTAFKKETGMTPSNYLRLARNKQSLP